MLSAAAWSRLDVLLDAASALDPADHATWLDAQRLRPELRAYLAARLAMGPDALGGSPPTAGEVGPGIRPDAPKPPTPRARPASDGRQATDRARRRSLRGGAVLVSAAALVALGSSYLVRSRSELAH